MVIRTTKRLGTSNARSFDVENNGVCENLNSAANHSLFWNGADACAAPCTRVCQRRWAYETDAVRHHLGYVFRRPWDVCRRSLCAATHQAERHGYHMVKSTAKSAWARVRSQGSKAVTVQHQAFWLDARQLFQ